MPLPKRFAGSPSQALMESWLAWRAVLVGKVMIRRTRWWPWLASRQCWTTAIACWMFSPSTDWRSEVSLSGTDVHSACARPRILIHAFVIG